MQGTVRWKWEDDQGKCHTVDIPNTLYCAELTYCLLSPQHLAAEKQDNSRKPRGTWLATFDDAMVLQWGQRKYQRTIKLSHKNAFVGIMRSAPGYKRSNKFLNLCALALPTTPLCFPAPLLHVEVPNPTLNNPAPTDDNVDTDDIYNWAFPTEPVRHDPLRFDFDSKKAGQPPTIVPTPDTSLDSEESPPTVGPSMAPASTASTSNVPFDSAQHELLKMHHCMGHMPFPLIREMIKKGGTYRNSKHLLTCPVPVCSACLFGKATKRAWHTKGPTSSLAPAQAPGDIVSMDQLESSTPGLVAQSKGKSTNKRFTCATVFVDHFSRLSYVHMQETNSAAETLAAKYAFERYALLHNVLTVKRYHGDNGRFSDNAFRKDCHKQGQHLTFCGVNAHFQNGIVERRIRDLQDRARTMIVHAKHRWPANAITSNLWPYAIRLANESSRCVPIKDGKNSMQLFTGHDFQISTHQHLHPFGCPMYVLKDEPATGKKGSKWGERARCGIYLGLSPEHARSVCLVMSLTTGLAPCITPVPRQG